MKLSKKQWVGLAAALSAALGVVVDQQVFSTDVTPWLVAGITFLATLAKRSE